MKKTIALMAACTALLSGPAMAQDFSAQLKARQGQFRILAINLGILGGMARGTVEYNAEAAGDAAGSIVAVSQIAQRALWPEGSDELGMDGTRAKVSIWDDWADFEAKWGDLGTAALAMQTAAAEGPEAIGGALRAMGGTCQACHEAHRVPMN